MKIEAFGYRLNLYCDRCGSEDIEVILPEPKERKVPLTQLPGFALPLIYKPTTYRCKRCGYEVKV